LKYIIEIACNDFATALSAANGGADRLELCSALSEGGITPSAGILKQCREKISIPLFPILRPRGGDFLYSDDEFEIIRKEAQRCKQMGFEGVVVGFLQKNGKVDREKTKRIVDVAYPLEVTFHRAFDRCKDPFEALEVIIESGCQRILTSGQQLKAMDGAGLISDLIKKANQRIIIMPGSGINPSNILQLAKLTRAEEFHASLRSTRRSEMDFIHPSFANTDDYTNGWINKEDVTALRNALA
jgi:copper homeostasis protein